MSIMHISIYFRANDNVIMCVPIGQQNYSSANKLRLSYNTESKKKQIDFINMIF